MSSRDQSFNDRASALWGHHRLGVEQLARIPGQRQFGFELGDAFVGRRELVGLHARGAFDDSGIDQRLALPPEQGGLSNPGFDGNVGDRFTGSQTLTYLPAHPRRIHTGHVTSR